MDFDGDYLYVVKSRNSLSLQKSWAGQELPARVRLIRVLSRQPKRPTRCRVVLSPKTWKSMEATKRQSKREQASPCLRTGESTTRHPTAGGPSLHPTF